MCEKCNDERGETQPGSGNFNICSKEELLLDRGYNYCPYCGRKLKKNAEEGAK